MGVLVQVKKKKITRAIINQFFFTISGIQISEVQQFKKNYYSEIENTNRKGCDNNSKY